MVRGHVAEIVLRIVIQHGPNTKRKKASKYGSGSLFLWKKNEKTLQLTWLSKVCNLFFFAFFAFFPLTDFIVVWCDRCLVWSEIGLYINITDYNRIPTHARGTQGATIRPIVMLNSYAFTPTLLSPKAPACECIPLTSIGYFASLQFWLWHVGQALALVNIYSNQNENIRIYKWSFQTSRSIEIYWLCKNYTFALECCIDGSPRLTLWKWHLRFTKPRYATLFLCSTLKWSSSNFVSFLNTFYADRVDMIWKLCVHDGRTRVVLYPQTRTEVSCHFEIFCCRKLLLLSFYWFVLNKVEQLQFYLVDKSVSRWRTDFSFDLRRFTPKGSKKSATPVAGTTSSPREDELLYMGRLLPIAPQLHGQRQLSRLLSLAPQRHRAGRCAPSDGFPWPRRLSLGQMVPASTGLFRHLQKCPTAGLGGATLLRLA